MAIGGGSFGYLMLVLHAHLPFVRHPEYSDSLEERWLYEAITETYIPLLDAFNRLFLEGIDFRVTMSFSPPLCNMLADTLLQERYLKRLSLQLELAEKEIFRTKYYPEYNHVAEMYLNKLNKIYDLFVNIYNKNLILGYKKLQDMGKLDIITSSATHAYLPLIESCPNAVRSQVFTGIRDYKRHFGKKPRGIWNAECGYYPGLENILFEGDIKYFFIDTHGMLLSDNYPEYGVYAPMETPNGMVFFARDVETSYSVWSSEYGYPGDPDYREFYRDIGFDLENDYIKPYIHESGLRVSTGFKYHRITGKEIPLERKEVYNPEKAFSKTLEHAGHFVLNREKDIDHLSVLMNREPVIVSMYDAELFGHWWYEGTDFIYNILKNISKSLKIKTITAPEYLEMYPDNQKATPPMSSWGYKGYNEFWLNDTNDWIYRHIHKINEIMKETANRFYKIKNPLYIRILNQMTREILLAQSSDWAFIMKSNTTVEYAVKITKDHIGYFLRMYDMIKNKNINEKFLSELEYKDNIFPDIDFRFFADKQN